MNDGPFSLTGKTIFVSGASSGIGRACAKSCARQGARLVIHGRNEQRLKETLDELPGPGNHQFVSFDLKDTAVFRELISDLVKKSGPFDGYVGSAGVTANLPLRSFAEHKLEELFQANVRGHLLFTKELTKKGHFAEAGGSVVYLSSVMAEVGEVAKSLYSMTKGALLAASRSLAIELAPRRIRLNCVSPGVVDTPMSENSVYSKDPTNRKRVEDLHPLGIGTPEDVANAVVYLLSPASRWVTGTNLIVDGGYTAR